MKGRFEKTPRTLHHITRMDYSRERKNGTITWTRGWWVRFSRTERANRPALAAARFFADLKHGGKRAALDEALRFRRRALKEVRPPRPEYVGLAPGEGYVRRTKWQGRPCWMAWMRRADGGDTRTKWLIDVWGAREAKRRCEAWLKKKQATTEQETR